MNNMEQFNLQEYLNNPNRKVVTRMVRTSELSALIEYARIRTRTTLLWGWLGIVLTAVKWLLALRATVNQRIRTGICSLTQSRKHAPLKREIAFW